MNDSLGKILVVDDDPDVLQAARLLLKKHAVLVHTESVPERIPVLLRDTAYDVILLDMNFTRDTGSGNEGFYWLDRILSIDPEAVVVLITAFGDVDMAVRAIKTGATDFVLKPWQNEKLLATVVSAVRLRRSRDEADRLRARQYALGDELDVKFRDFIGVSQPMRNVFATIEKVAKTDANVLVLGENGTGKELVARALHRHSRRSGEVFVSVDMAALPEALFESELFGHTKGSFTDAKGDRAGRFEVASGGTLFLDEIGNLTLPLQAKLLTVLQQREVIRIGSNRPRPIDVRLICATNRPLHEMVRQGSFRQDLLFRINTVEIRLPPLRERREDIALLAAHFLGHFEQKYHRGIKAISPPALRRMEEYGWPGNVRELEHMIERAVIMTESNELQPRDFSFPEAYEGHEEPVLDSYNLDEVEKTIIRRAIDRHQGNISKAASELGLTRASLYRRLEKHGL